jgi:hypothetical protein
MTDPENRLSPRHPGTAKAWHSPKKPAPLGSDFALNAPAASGEPLTLTYWDVWFALVATRDCGGDLGCLAERLGEDRTALAFGRQSVERKQSHVRDLQKRLAAAGVTVADVLTASGDLARTELRRARKRVLEPTEREREWSAAMRQTPRKRRYAESLRGAWPRFPVSPEPYAAEIYSPSGTLFAYLLGQPPAAGRGMLALADPVFATDRPKAGPRALPPGGLLLTVVLPGSNAARARLRADDVLLRYAGTELKSTAELGRLVQGHSQDQGVAALIWRDGRTLERTLAGGKLGAVVAPKPAAEALAERRQGDQLLAQSRAGTEDDWPDLPGTRVEAARLGVLCRQAGLPFRLLADSDASEQELGRLARSKELAAYRYIHLATHGELNDRLPLQSAVILSRDRLPDPLKQLEAGQPVYDGRLTAEKVLERWDLHAELVTLSACQTALGKYEGGEGFVGFTQALLLSGARSVCLSLWKVDDTATALLMQRFYANLLGQRKGLKAPLGKAEALAEAKQWLRDLTAEEATQQAAALTQGVARGKGRKPSPLLPATKGRGTSKADRPYAHPYYWAAFVLVGAGA